MKGADSRDPVQQLLSGLSHLESRRAVNGGCAARITDYASTFRHRDERSRPHRTRRYCRQQHRAD